MVYWSQNDYLYRKLGIKMKLKYKKLIIIITVVTLGLGFFILTLIPTGGTNTQNAASADLELNKNEDINKLVSDYFAAKKTVNVDAMSNLVSDSNQINKEKLVAMAEYVEDYKDINCYLIHSADLNAYRVYVKYNMKLKNINTLAPCLSAFYITSTSDGKYVIYLSALDEVQEEFITSADKNDSIVKLKEQVAEELKKAVAGDDAFKQLYEKMNNEINTAAANKGATPTLGQATKCTESAGSHTDAYRIGGSYDSSGLANSYSHSGAAKCHSKPYGYRSSTVKIQGML